MLRALHSEFSGPPGVGTTTLPRRLLTTTFKLVSFTGGLESREVAFGGLQCSRKRYYPHLHVEWGREEESLMLRKRILRRIRQFEGNNVREDRTLIIMCSSPPVQVYGPDLRYQIRREVIRGEASP